MPRPVRTPQTDGERRQYSRGYNRGRSRVYDRITQVIKIAQGYRARLTDPSTPNCGHCSRWLRGDGSNNSAACKWGSCRADFEYGIEGRMWVDGAWDRPKQIITSEDFGCTAFLPVNPSGRERAEMFMRDFETEKEYVEYLRRILRRWLRHL